MEPSPAWESIWVRTTKNEARVFTVNLSSSGLSRWIREHRCTRSEDTQYWTRNLQAASSPGSLDSASLELYEQRVRETLEREMEAANRKEDEGPIRAVQQAVLAALRKGKSFRTAHHEGGTRLYFDGTKFVKQVYGVEEELTDFPTDDEMLACLRSFYDWESRKDTSPHRPPELEVWNFIERQLV